MNPVPVEGSLGGTSANKQTFGIHQDSIATSLRKAVLMQLLHVSSGRGPPDTPMFAAVDGLAIHVSFSALMAWPTFKKGG